MILLLHKKKKEIKMWFFKLRNDFTVNPDVLQQHFH